MQSIYLDHNATTPIHPKVVEAMARCYSEISANPASAHRPGQKARGVLENARERIAQLLDADRPPPCRDRIIFTSGGTEANNLAILGIARGLSSHSTSQKDNSSIEKTPSPQNAPRLQSGGEPRIIISSGEHQSVIEPAEHLLEQSWRLDTLGLTPQGVVRVDQLESLLQRSTETCLVSVQLGNHETGVLQAIGQMADLCRRAGVPLHTDAVQAVGKMPVSFHALGVAAMSITAHKFGGPQGIGALLIRDGVPLAPLMFGGHQQAGLRPGTESVALAVGMAAALEICCREQEQFTQHLQSLRDRFEQGLQAALPEIVVHGVNPVGQTFLSVPLLSRSERRQRRSVPDQMSVPGQAGMPAPLADARLPQTSNVAFSGLDGQMLLMALDLAGVACSVGSACSSGSSELSPTLRAMDLPNSLVSSSLRFSFGITNTEPEIDEAVRRIVRVCGELRANHL
jgi:cysteine desulfurase